MVSGAAVGSVESYDDLDLVKALAGAVPLDDHKRHPLDDLIGGKALLAVETFPPAADGGTVLRRARVDDRAVGIAAKRAFHV